MDFLPVIVLVSTFIFFIVIGTPIAWSIGISTLLTMIVSIPVFDSFTTIAQRMATSLDSFTLIAIPFFILSGNLMTHGGIANRLIDFAKTIIGSFPGGLALINIISAILMGSIAGSAMASASAMGSILGPEMEKQGYSKKFAAAITAASSVIGPIIPPSGIMIIYAYVMGESVAALFLAGVVPGILVGVSLMILVRLMANRYNFPPATEKYSWGERGKASLKAFFPLMTPVIILGGILGGIFTPTEASAVAAAYALFIGLFVLKTLEVKDIPKVFQKAALVSSVVLLLVGAAMAFKTVVSLSHAPEYLADFVLSLSDNPYVLLFLINILLFIVGMFLDAGPAIIILGPILGPVFTDLGVHPVHFAIIMSVNLTVGLATPPMGLVLFVASSVSGEKVETIAKAILPFLAVEIIVIFLITYFPSLSMTIPLLTGFAK